MRRIVYSLVPTSTVTARAVLFMFVVETKFPRASSTSEFSHSMDPGDDTGVLFRSWRLIQIVFFQEFGPEVLRRGGNVRPTLWRKVHEIPIRPHRVDVIARQFSSPEMKNPSILPPEYMH